MSGGQEKIQVEAKHYGKQYDHKARWLNYWYQIQEVLKIKPATCLEIGIGSGLVSGYLRKQGIAITTLDIDPELKPDIVGSITSIPLPDKSFDTVLAAEVLEHLPYDQVLAAFKEMARVAKKNIIVSVPDSRRTLLYLSLKLPFLRRCDVFWKVQSGKEHKWDGQHYWELGKKGFPLKKLEKTISSAGLKITRHFVPFDCPTKHIYLLSVKS